MVHDTAILTVQLWQTDRKSVTYSRAMNGYYDLSNYAISNDPE